VFTFTCSEDGPCMSPPYSWDRGAIIFRGLDYVHVTIGDLIAHGGMGRGDDHRYYEP
jgi:hypothetical protein